MILRETLLAPQSAPRDPTCLLDQKRHEISEKETGTFLGGSHVLFQESPIPNSVLPLLLTNRQLYDDTRDMLRREFSAQLPKYTLDVMYLKDCTLWPTWTSVPVRASHVDSVTAQFRLFNCPGGLPMPRIPPRRGIFGSDIIWTFYHLFIAAVKFGPYGRPITMRRLVLDFLPVEEDDILPMDPSTWGPASSLPDKLRAWNFYGQRLASGWTPPLDAKVVGPAMVLDFLEAKLRRLLLFNIYCFDYCKILYESIGEIEIRLAGEVYANFDLAEELAGREIWGPPGSERYTKWHSVFCPWRERVEARRRELGMPVNDRT